jgi:ferric-dicitrate binding protein FerR (iron transport regulator)
VNGPLEEKRLEELMAAYLAGTLAPEDEGRFNAWLESSPENLRLFIRQLELHSALREMYAEVSPSPRITQRHLRRPSRERNPSWAVLTAGAAAALVAVTLFFVLGPSESEPTLSPKAKETRVRASREAEAQRRAERERMERERVLAEARLREIEEKRRALAHPSPAEAPEMREKRERDLLALKNDQERIEQELREAVLAAQRAARPASEAGPRDPEKYSQPPAPPAFPPQTTTQVVAAQVVEVSGDASRVTKEGKSPLAAGADLFSAQGVETGGGASRLVLRFPDKTRVEFGPDFLLSEIKTENGKLLLVRKGTLRAEVARQPKDQPMMFRTSYGDVKVLGTVLRIVTDPDPKRGMRVEVEEGKVELKNPANRVVTVEGGQYATAATGVALVARPFEVLRTIDDMEGPLAWRQQPDSRVLGISLVRDRVHGGRSSLRVVCRPQAGDPATYGTMNRPLHLQPDDRKLRFYMLVEESASGASWTLQFRLRDTSCWMIGEGDFNGLSPGWNRIELDLPRNPKLVSDPKGPYDPAMVEGLMFSICQKSAVLLLDDFALISAPDKAK